MAGPYYADNYSDPVPEIANALVPVVRPIIYTNKTALIINDLIYLAPLPGVQGIYLLDWSLDLPDMDSGGPTFTCALGDSTAYGRFYATGTKGQSAARVCSLVDGVLGALPCRYKPDGTAAKLGDDALILKVIAAAGTATTTGTILGWVKYCLFGTGPLLFGNEPA